MHRLVQSRQRWLSLWERLGGNKTNGFAAYGGIALHYGGEPGRAYHNFNHIEHGLAELDEIREIALSDFSQLDIDVLELMWWFHDIICTIGRKPPGVASDEKLSADLLVKILEHAGFEKSMRTECRNGILCTMHSDEYPPVTLSQKFLVDIDLAILGQPEDVFDEYEEKIRKEYSWVDPETYQKTRAGILRKMLARTYVYRTAHFFDKYEVQARANLTRSIQQLLLGS